MVYPDDLGRTLFNIYMNGLFLVNTTSEIVDFANDSAKSVYQDLNCDDLKNIMENNFVTMK